MTDLKTLLDDVENFALETGVKPSTLSGKLFGDGLRYGLLRSGKATITIRVLERAREKLDVMKKNRAKLDRQLGESEGVLSS